MTFAQMVFTGRIKVESDSGAEQWMDDPNELVEWLEKHPTVTATIGRWSLAIEGPDLECVALGSTNLPCGVSAPTEEHAIEQVEGGFSTTWDFC